MIFDGLLTVQTDFRAIEQASLVTGAPSFCGISRFSLSLSTPLLGSAWALLERFWVPVEGSWTPLRRLLGRSWRPLQGILKPKNGVRSWKRKKQRKKCLGLKTLNLLPPPGAAPGAAIFGLKFFKIEKMSIFEGFQDDIPIQTVFGTVFGRFLTVFAKPTMSKSVRVFAYF